MELILRKEFENRNILDSYIRDNDLVTVSYRYAVIALITDTKGNVVISRRGDTARDDTGWLADIGGAVEDSDATFRDALMREIREEVGEQVDIKIDDFVCGVLNPKYDPKILEDVNWIFLVYKCTYYGGELLDNEHGKINAFEYYKIDEIPLDNRLNTSIFAWDYYRNEYHKCYSYAMGIEKAVKKLDKKKFSIVEDDDDYEVVFGKENCEVWEEFIVNNMSDGYWNEYLVDGEVRFVFKNDDGTIEKYVLNKDNNQDILVKCRLFAESQFSSVRAMYENTPFYRDKLDGVVFYD